MGVNHPTGISAVLLHPEAARAAAIAGNPSILETAGVILDIRLKGPVLRHFRDAEHPQHEEHNQYHSEKGHRSLSPFLISFSGRGLGFFSSPVVLVQPKTFSLPHV
jgi:hypothetical protein